MPPRRMLALVLSLAFAASCGGSPPVQRAVATPSPAPESAARPQTPEEKIGVEEYAAQHYDTPEHRAQVRQAVSEYVKAQMPGGSVRGVSSYACTGNIYFVGVDISSGRQQRTVNLLVRLFMPDDGKSYWKVEPLDSEIGRVFTRSSQGLCRQED